MYLTKQIISNTNMSEYSETENDTFTLFGVTILNL